MQKYKKTKEQNTVTANQIKNCRELTNEFDVRDALGGDVTGDYDHQVKELVKAGRWCSRRIYDVAYQMTVQP